MKIIMNYPKFLVWVWTLLDTTNPCGLYPLHISWPLLSRCSEWWWWVWTLLDTTNPCGLYPLHISWPLLSRCSEWRWSEKKLLLKGVAALRHCREPVNWLEGQDLNGKKRIFFFQISDSWKSTEHFYCLQCK